MEGGVPIQVAARRMGLTVEAVRKRARRGSLTAYKRDGGWYIVIPDGGGDGPDIVRAAEQDVPDATRTPPDAPESTITLALVESLRDELRALHGQLSVKDAQLEQAATERAELRRLLGNAQQQATLMLTGGPQQDVPEPSVQAVQDESYQRPVSAVLGADQAFPRRTWRWPWERRD